MRVSRSSAPSASGGSALFSECGRYRYKLTRRLRADHEAGRSCLFIMLNPSTADAETDDPTIRRCTQFANNWDMSELHVVNLFALRATEPSALQAAADPVGPSNDDVIAESVLGADTVVIAWGNHGLLGGRTDEVRTLLRRLSVRPFHFGLNRTGEPRHPLYLPSQADLLPASA